jgi:deazaflavin-dependent oxidoreductase (nitroreductase family)
MPLPDWLARFNRRGTNRLTRTFAGRMPGFAILMHAGRTSGRRYRTPVNLFRSNGAYVIALTYGRDRDWVRNVTASGRCEVQTRGDVVRLEDPRIVTDAKASMAPPAIRTILRAMKVTEFMLLRRTDAPHRGSGTGPSSPEPQTGRGGS